MITSDREILTTQCNGGGQFEERTALRFINVVCDKADSVGLRDVLFRQPPPALELLGYNFSMRAVAAREPGTGKPTFAEPWSWPKTFHAALDRSGGGELGDEDGEDWEWLLRHHGHNDKIDIGGCLLVVWFVGWADAADASLMPKPSGC